MIMSAGDGWVVLHRRFPLDEAKAEMKRAAFHVK
jgi:hypothetical protein